MTLLLGALAEEVLHRFRAISYPTAGCLLMSRTGMSRQNACMGKEYYIYIMTNRPRGTLYIGVTGHLVRRVHEHRKGAVPGFTHKYRLKRLVYFECCREVMVALEREKRLKRWRRAWKLELIEEANPSWRDLFDEIAA